MSNTNEQEGREFLREVSIHPVASELKLALDDFRVAFHLNVRSLIGKNPEEPITETDRQLLARAAQHPELLLRMSQDRIERLMDKCATAMEREARANSSLELPSNFPLRDKILGRLNSAVTEDLTRVQTQGLARESFIRGGLKLAEFLRIPLDELSFMAFDAEQSLNEQVVGLIVRKTLEEPK